ncbi:MAG: Gfo/Idh/MocA family oxidoreductase [Actinomycetota bacterium]|nr:Gfo/Idh/MocA family oxidoreductase [Actinomycetota bacterium]
MGRNHARVTANIRDVDVVLVVDPDERRARALAEPAGARWAAVLPDRLDGIDTAAVATPTEFHRQHGIELMQAGVHVLMEKPLAPTLADAEALVKAAAANRVVLMVGHVEQFNTAVLELDRWVDGVVHVESARVGPDSGRVQESVVFDLMIHDLDIVRRIVRSPLTRVHATAQHARTATEDLACALLCFENGVTANLTASRIGQNKVRTLEITQRANTVSVDLVQQTVMIRRMSQSEYLGDTDTVLRQSGVVEMPYLENRGEPLLLEIRHFFDCVKKGTPPRVSGEDGLETVRWALRVAEAAQAAC